MFIIIDQGGKRIKITGDMQIYGHGPDLVLLAEQISRQVWQNKVDYGWIKLKGDFSPMTPTTKEEPPPDPTPESPKMIEWEV